MVQTVTIRFVRHGETEITTDGHGNAHLTTTGRQQAEALAAAFRGWPIDVAYSSPLSQAVDTANIILKGQKFAKAMVLHPLLTERSLGQWEGLDPDQQAWDDPQAVADAGVESHDVCGQRLFDFWQHDFLVEMDDLLRDMASSGALRVLIVGHGVPFNAFTRKLRYAESQDIEFPAHLRVYRKMSRGSYSTLLMKRTAWGEWQGCFKQHRLEPKPLPGSIHGV